MDLPSTSHHPSEAEQPEMVIKTEPPIEIIDAPPELFRKKEQDPMLTIKLEPGDPDYDKNQSTEECKKKEKPYLDTNDSYSASGARKKIKACRRMTRKVLYDWKEPAVVSQLISLVKQRRMLWDATLSTYKLPKVDVWREIAAELGNDIGWNDAKVKWMNLRVTFRSNMIKLRSKQSCLGTSELADVVWKHFKEMMFLEAAEVQDTNQSEPTSSLAVPNSTIDPSLLDDVSLNAPPSIVSQRRKRHKTPPTPSPPPPAKPSTSSASMKQLAAQVLSNYHKRQRPDQHSAFGEYIASESRILPSGLSDELRDRLYRTLSDFKAELRRTASQVAISDESTSSIDATQQTPFMNHVIPRPTTLTDLLKDMTGSTK